MERQQYVQLYVYQVFTVELHIWSELLSGMELEQHFEHSIVDICAGVIHVQILFLVWCMWYFSKLFICFPLLYYVFSPTIQYVGHVASPTLFVLYFCFTLIKLVCGNQNNFLLFLLSLYMYGIMLCCYFDVNFMLILFLVHWILYK